MATNSTPVNTSHIELYDGSTKVWGTAPGSGTPVTPPGTPGTPTASAITATGATLTWAASTAGTNAVAGYDVYSVSGTASTKVASSTTTSATLTGLTPGTAYTFDVVARDSAGNQSSASPTVTVTTTSSSATPPSAPTALTVTATGSTSVGLSWTAAKAGTSAIASYTVYKTGSPATAVATAAAPAVTATVSGLAPSTAYQFYVVATDVNGLSSAASSSVPATTTAGTTPPPSSISVQYETSVTTATTQSFQPMLNVVNNGTSAVPLSSVTIRYWFTSDGGSSTFATNCWYAAVGCANVTQSVSSATATTGADHYVQVGFTTAAGSLAPGASTGQVQSAVNKSDWSNFTQTNDYSFNAADTAWTANTNVTVYVNGTLVWGTEPH